MVPLFGVLIEHQVTTHDVGVVTGKLCFDKGLCNVLPVFCNEHQTGRLCRMSRSQNQCSKQSFSCKNMRFIVS